MWGCMIHSYVIGRGNTATAYLQAGVIRPAPGPTADAVVDVQVQRTGGESRLKDEEVVLFFLAEKRAERTCGEEKMATPGWTEKKRSSAPLRRGSVPQKIYWEGINLNKISKKIVSAVTMGAFALTLIPAAAFAAPTSVTGTDATVVQETANTVNINFTDAVTDAVVHITKADEANDLGLTLYNGNSATATGATYGTTGTTERTASNSTEYRLFGLDTGYYDIWVTEGADGTEVVRADDYYVSATPSVSNSQLLVEGDNAKVAVEENEVLTFNVNVRDEAGATSYFDLSGDGLVWATDKNGNVLTTVTFTDANGTPLANTNGIYTLNTGITEGTTLKAIFAQEGTDYTIHVAPGSAYVANMPQVLPIKVDVTAAEVVTDNIAITNVTDMNSDGVQANAAKDAYTVRISDEVTPSDTKVYTVTGKAWTDDAQTVAAAGEKIAVSADAGLNLQGLAEDGTVTTKANGEFTFKFTMEDAASYDITLREVNNEASATLTVVQADVDAATIEKVSDGGYVLAGNDYDYASQVYGIGTAYFSDAVQFAITDVYGRDAVGAGVLADEAAASTTDEDAHAAAVRIIDKGENSTLTAQDLVLAWDEEAGVYTLAYVDADKDGAAKDLTPGEYSVRVALNNGGRNAVTVNFTVAEFGEVQELVLDTTAHASQSWEANDNAITAIDNQVALGQWVNVVPKYVDANGLKVKADISDLQVGINGDAVIDRHITKDTIAFRVANNTAANNDYVGSIITIKVNDTTTNKYVEKELTVVKNYQAETVSIDPTQGVVGEPNTVNVTVVAGEEISKVNGKLSATIVSQSDEEANVDLKVNPDVRNGKASMYLESDKAGTVDVRVVVTADNGELYADTFTYTFGDEDPYAGTTVVMVIGSDQYLINNEVLDGSVDNLGAPYVDSAWRTMVPVCVLAESFGADVDFDEEAQTVTIVDGDTTIVMTVGSTEYTINGEAAEAMDTAPVIGSDNRTYVPVRFVAEGLGYEVSPLYNAENGTTSSVVFQK